MIKLLTDIQVKILRLLLRHITMSRYELVKESKIPRTTLFDNLEILLNMNYINRMKVKRKGVGRPRILWFIERNMLSVIKEKGFFDNKYIN